MSTTSQSEGTFTRESIVGLSIGIVVFNFASPAMLEGARTYVGPMILLGVTAAQIGLLATWGVFSSLPFSRSLPITAVVGTLLYGCTATSLLVTNDFEAEVFFVMLFGLMLCPAILFAVQTPLWATRIFLRAEVAPDGQPPTGSYQRRTGIKDMLVGTAVLSVAMALAKAAPSVVPQGVVDTFFVGFAAICGCAAAVSLIVILPLLFFTLTTQHTTHTKLGCAIWAGLVIAAPVTLIGSLTSGAGDVIGAFLIGIGSFAATLYLGFLLVRNQGYRFRWLAKNAS